MMLGLLCVAGESLQKTISSVNLCCSYYCSAFHLGSFSWESVSSHSLPGALWVYATCLPLRGQVQFKGTTLQRVPWTLQYLWDARVFFSTLFETREERDGIQLHPQILRGKEHSNGVMRRGGCGGGYAEGGMQTGGMRREGMQREGGRGKGGAQWGSLISRFCIHPRHSQPSCLSPPRDNCQPPTAEVRRTSGKPGAGNRPTASDDTYHSEHTNDQEH